MGSLLFLPIEKAQKWEIIDFLTVKKQILEQPGQWSITYTPPGFNFFFGLLALLITKCTIFMKCWTVPTPHMPGVGIMVRVAGLGS